MNREQYVIRISILLSIFISLVFSIPLPSDAASTYRLEQRRTKRTVPRKPARPRMQHLAKDPYLGAIVIDAETGTTLFQDKPDISGYPASLTKMMTFLVLLEKLKEGDINLDDRITVSAEVSRIGGSQVYLKEKEVFTVDDLLYALMVKSANDAALALALHAAETKDDFINLMNKRAEEIGMEETVFHSVHGLPPSRGQLPDVSTPRDMAKLAQEILKYPEALKYTSTKVRKFRPETDNPFIMRNHNHLVRKYDDCDGLKTGFFYLGGFSIAATAVNEKGRAIAVVLGSFYSKVRDKKARELLTAGLTEIATRPPAPTPPPPAAPKVMTATLLPLDRPFRSGDQYLFVVGLVCGGFLVIRKYNS